MNIALEQTEEHVDGKVTNRYGDAFIRGNNGAFVLVRLLRCVLDSIIMPIVLYISADEEI